MSTGPHPQPHPQRRRRAALIAATVLAPLVAVDSVGPSQAANSDACRGGGYSLVNLSTGAVLARGAVDRTIPAARFRGGRIGVRGRYNTFNIRPRDFAVLNYAFTGAPNAKDITGGRRTPVFASKVPDHRGLSLRSGLAVQLDEEGLEVSRTGPGLSMKIQANDCAQGGIFQMEPQRRDDTRTRITHRLARSSRAMTPFYFDNAKFRARVGQFVGSGCRSVATGPPGRFCVKVETRTNIGNRFSPDFVARDSTQVADPVLQARCNTAKPVRPSIKQCGGVSIWRVASGGRLGFVTGEDAVEMANSPKDCVHKCQAQNQVRGRLAVLGFPFPVPAGSRLVPRVSRRPLLAPAR